MFSKEIFKLTKNNAKKCSLQYMDSIINLVIAEKQQDFGYIIKFFLSHFDLELQWKKDNIGTMYIYAYSTYIKMFDDYLSEKKEFLFR